MQVANASQSKKEKNGSKTEAEQAKNLIFSLSPSLAFSSLPLLIFPGKPFPCESATNDLTTDERETLRVSQFAPIVAKTLFIKEAEQMKWLNTDISSIQLALDQTPEVLNRVRVNVPIHILHGMINNCVLILGRESIVGSQRVAKESGTGLNVLSNASAKFVLASRGHREGANVTTPLNYTKSDGFVFAASASDNSRSAPSMHISRFTADEAFVDLNLSSELRSSLVLHSLAHAVQHEPCGFLCKAKVPADLITTNSVLAVGNEPRSSSRLFRGIGESSKIVPTLIENCFRHARHFQILRVARNMGFLVSQYGHSTPFAQRFSMRYFNELSQ